MQGCSGQRFWGNSPFFTDFIGLNGMQKSVTQARPLGLDPLCVVRTLHKICRK